MGRDGKDEKEKEGTGRHEEGWGETEGWEKWRDVV